MASKPKAKAPAVKAASSPVPAQKVTVRGGVRSIVNPPFLHLFFTGDVNQQIHAKIVSVVEIPAPSAKEIAALPEELRKDFLAFLRDYMVVLVEFVNGGYAQDTVVSSKGQTPKKGDTWVFTCPQPNSTHPFGERLA